MRINGVYYSTATTPASAAEADAAAGQTQDADGFYDPGQVQDPPVKPVFLGMRVGRCWGCDVTRDGIFVEPRFVFGKPYVTDAILNAALTSLKVSRKYDKKL